MDNGTYFVFDLDIKKLAMLRQLFYERMILLKAA